MTRWSRSPTCSIFARWSRSAISSARSGWKPRMPETLDFTSGVPSHTSTHSRAVRRASAIGSSVRADSPSHWRQTRASIVTRRTTPPADWAAGSAACWAAANWAADSAAATFAAATDSALEGDFAILALLTWGTFARSISAVPYSQDQCRDNRDKGHDSRHQKDADHERRRLRRRPLLQRLGHQAVMDGSIAQVCGDVL